MAALSAKQPQGGCREKDHVRGQENADTERAIVHERKR
jgi:hypothetical protein